MASSGSIFFCCILLIIERFRKFLRDQLRKDGWRVNMVGSKSEGSMADNVRQFTHPEPVHHVEHRV